MLFDLSLSLLAASLVSGASIPHQDASILNARQNSGDPGLQDIPTTAKPDNTFSNGAAMVAGWSPSDETPPAVYGNRTMDLPFGRLYVRIFEIIVPFLEPDSEPRDTSNECLLRRHLFNPRVPS